MFGVVTTWVNDNSAHPELPHHVQYVPNLSVAYRPVSVT
ncbi:hypothetical protein MMAG44476_32847 [Mycolicibacterium mageritense DSM 44476 = CIP 104973]